MHRTFLLFVLLLLIVPIASADHGVEAAGYGIALIIGYILFQALPFLGIVVFSILRFSLKKSALSIGTYICFLPFIAFRVYLFVEASEQHDQNVKFYENLEQAVPYDKNYASSWQWLVVAFVALLGYLILDIYLNRRANKDPY